jgi:pSer/pThr/pTyr-binding forkhead associated (FHA) protein
MKFVYKIGKNPENDLVIDERTADEFHATLELTESEDLIISDLNSKYGTVVSSERIKSHSLQPDDKLQIGFTTIDWPTIKAKLLNSKSSSKTLPLDEMVERKPEILTLASENQRFSEWVFPAERDQVKQENLLESQEIKPEEIQHEEVPANQKPEPVNIKLDPEIFTPKVIVVDTSVESQNLQGKSPDNDRLLYVLLVIILAAMMLLGWFIGKMSEL